MHLIHHWITSLRLYIQRPNKRVRQYTAALLAEIAANGDINQLAEIELPPQHPREPESITQLREKVQAAKKKLLLQGERKRIKQLIEQFSAIEDIDARIKQLTSLLYRTKQTEFGLERVPSDSAKLLRKVERREIMERLEKDARQRARELFDQVYTYDADAFAQLYMMVFGNFYESEAHSTFWLATGSRLPAIADWNVVMCHNIESPRLMHLTHADWDAPTVNLKAAEALQNRDAYLAKLCLAFAESETGGWVRMLMGEMYEKLKQLVLEFHAEQGLFQNSGNIVVRED